MIYILTLILSLGLLGTTVSAQAHAAAVEVTCEPVHGNEPFFGGETVFNTFYGRPVPLTFVMRGDKSQAADPTLVIEAPAGVKLVEAFQSSRTLEDALYSIASSSMTRDGKPYVRYRITGDKDHTLFMQAEPKWLRSEITVGFDAPKSFTGGTVYWSLENGGKTVSAKQFTLRFHTPQSLLSADQRGRFRILCWSSTPDLAWHDSSLQKSAADLLLSSGIAQVHALGERGTRKGAFSQYLSDRGIDLMYRVPGFSIAGPMNVGHWDGKPAGMGLPGAMGPDGKRSDRYSAPIPTLHNEKFRKIFQDYVRKTIETQPKAGYVTFDYEPWRLPEKMGFGPETQAAFRKQYQIPESATNQEILDVYRKQWTMFWTGISNDLLRMMAQSIRAAAPGIKIISYTYFRDYEMPDDRQWTQFKGCPKDPRQEAQAVDEMMFSAYHIHGKKLVDAIRMSQRHVHHADMSMVIAIARRTSSWVRQGDDLSPQQVYQTAVLAGAMGMKRLGIYPGVYIDGAFYTALGKASRLIWAHEKYYYDGQDIHDQVKVKPAESSVREDAYAYTAQSADGRQLVTLFNFSNQSQSFTMTKDSHSQTVSVSPHDVKLVEW